MTEVLPKSKARAVPVWPAMQQTAVESIVECIPFALACYSQQTLPSMDVFIMVWMRHVELARLDCRIPIETIKPPILSQGICGALRTHLLHRIVANPGSLPLMVDQRAEP
jgi:hypothetical protein